MPKPQERKRAVEIVAENFEACWNCGVSIMRTQARKVSVIEPSEPVARARQRIADERARVANAKSIRYISKGDAFALAMRSGVEVLVPRASVDELCGVPKVELVDVTLTPGGDAIAFEALNVHISVPGLLREVLGFNTGQRAGGRARTPAKLAAVRRNGAKGGRPRKKATA